MFVIKSSRYLQACSKWVVLMMICTNYSKKTTIVVNNFLWRCTCGSINVFVCTSVSPMWGFLMRFCKQLLSVLVSSRLVDFRNMSSISVELKSQNLWLMTGQYSQIHTDILLSAWIEASSESDQPAVQWFREFEAGINELFDLSIDLRNRLGHWQLLWKILLLKRTYKKI